MTPEELDEARAKEAYRQADGADRYLTHFEAATIAARLARENWTPPEPVDPDLLAFREWLVEQWPDLQEEATSGETDSIIPARAYLAGARMARERAKVLEEFAVALETFGLDDSISAIPRGAREALAKYRGEA